MDWFICYANTGDSDRQPFKLRSTSGIGDEFEVFGILKPSSNWQDYLWQCVQLNTSPKFAKLDSRTFVYLGCGQTASYMSLLASWPSVVVVVTSSLSCLSESESHEGLSINQGWGSVLCSLQLSLPSIRTSLTWPCIRAGHRQLSLSPKMSMRRPDSRIWLRWCESNNLIDAINMIVNQKISGQKARECINWLSPSAVRHRPNDDRMNAERWSDFIEDRDIAERVPLLLITVVINLAYFNHQLSNRVGFSSVNAMGRVFDRFLFLALEFRLLLSFMKKIRREEKKEAPHGMGFNYNKSNCEK